MRHLIDPMDLSVEDIDRLLDRADDIAKNPEEVSGSVQTQEISNAVL